jgi:hypothetical protein
MILHERSHIDHGLSEAQIAYILELCEGRREYFSLTAELPPHLGTVPCGIYGPVMNDPPIPESAVTYATRGGRRIPSRLISLPPRQVRIITVVGGPRAGLPCVLYTAFGGPAAPREPGDPRIREEMRQESVEFWSVHALSAG